jgi:hypothetical protein
VFEIAKNGFPAPDAVIVDDAGSPKTISLFIDNNSSVFMRYTVIIMGEHFPIDRPF